MNEKSKEKWNYNNKKILPIIKERCKYRSVHLRFGWKKRKKSLKKTKGKNKDI